MRCFYVFLAFFALVSFAHAKIEPVVRDFTPSQNIQAENEPDAAGLAAQSIPALNEGDIDEALGQIYEEGIPSDDEIASEFSLFGSSAFLAASSVFESAVPISPASQSTTGTSSVNDALGSLVHYKITDHSVGIFALLLAGVAGAGAALL